MGCGNVGVVDVISGYYVTTMYVMGGLELRVTFNVPIWLVDMQESEFGTV
jgi:hypothetical protein